MKKIMYSAIIGSLCIYGIHAAQGGKVTLAPPALYNFGLGALDKTKPESRKIIAALFAWLRYEGEERADELSTLNNPKYYPQSTPLVVQEEKKVQEIVKDNGAEWNRIFNEHQAVARDLEQCKNQLQQTVRQDKQAVITTLNKMLTQ